MIILTNGNGWTGPVAWERNKSYSRTKFTKNSVQKHERKLPLRGREYIWDNNIKIKTKWMQLYGLDSTNSELPAVL